jgi:N-methylhydantoinase A
LPTIDTVGGHVEPTERSVYFRERGWTACPVYRREALTPGTQVDGPAIIEQMDSTTLVSPDFTACVDSATNILLTRKEGLDGASAKR